jgi:peroxiredoxin Q/BCP
MVLEVGDVAPPFVLPDQDGIERSLAALGVRVVGISPDDITTHSGFAREHGLPQTLLADPDHRVLGAYSAWGEKVLYGRTSVGVIRSSVLIGADGRILKIWRRAQASTHAERALKACRELLA